MTIPAASSSWILAVVDCAVADRFEHVAVALAWENWAMVFSLDKIIEMWKLADPSSHRSILPLAFVLQHWIRHDMHRRRGRARTPPSSQQPRARTGALINPNPLVNVNRFSAFSTRQRHKNIKALPTIPSDSIPETPRDPHSTAMGERHQIFVVARVGKRYRTLAVIHHQYLYDCLALSACLLLISIFSDKANRRPLEMELGLAEEFYSDPNNTESDSSDSTTSYASFRAKPVRFPFIGTCLVVGASTAGLDPDFPRASTVHFEPEDTGFAEGDNNTGITVLDITDLDNVRYCFVAWRRIGWRWDLDSDLAQLGPPPPLNTPWSGAEYGRHWQGFHDPEVSIDGKRDRLATKLAEFPLVNVTALAGQHLASHFSPIFGYYRPV